jgi:hypothetical protein
MPRVPALPIQVIRTQHPIGFIQPPPADGAVHLDVAVPEARIDVLDALADRAAARIGS